MHALADALVMLSRWVDDHPANAARDREAATWGRLSKVAEEAGEVIREYVGHTGQNPRKGVTDPTMKRVAVELLETAVTALAAYEHVTGHDGRSMHDLVLHLRFLLERAGLRRRIEDMPTDVVQKSAAIDRYREHVKQIRSDQGGGYSVEEQTLLLIGFGAGWDAASEARERMGD